MIFLEFTGAGDDPTHVARLQARSMFKDIRAEAEEYIYKKLVRPAGQVRFTSHLAISCLDQSDGSISGAGFLRLDAE